jgi:glycerol-3-phosphate acyltransferase PlsX
VVGTVQEPGRVTTTIALDAFGGDSCPEVEVEAALKAAHAGISVLLVGDRERLAAALARRGVHGVTTSGPTEGQVPDLPLRIHHAAEVITMEDTPSKVVRTKTDASMLVCFDLVKQGKAHAVVSAGNSGAMLACGLLKFGRLKGIDRPAIGASIPRMHGQCVLLDMGANVECKPVNLVQFAVLGAVYARTSNTLQPGATRARVGLLSNGTEEGKGTELTRAAHRALGAHPSPDFEYIGYVEGKDIFKPSCDVVVTDGFTGNIALKVLEATAVAFAAQLRAAVEERTLSKVGALLMRPALALFKERLDPDTHGGAPLLGVEGLAIISHGGASSTALYNAIRVARDYTARDLTPALRAAVATHKDLFAAAKREEGAG